MNLRKLAGWILGGVLLSGALVVAFQLSSGHGRVEFVVHKPQYQGIVEEVARRVSAPGEQARFKAQRLDAPETIQELGPDESIARGQGAGCIWASRDEHGRLSVWIETVDLGHAGEFGYAWSEAEAPSGPEEWSERWALREQLADGWWAIVYDLG